MAEKNMNLETQAQRYFNIQLPITESVLKSAFRRASRELHPDTGGDHDRFVDMKRTYDAILKAKLVLADDGATIIDSVLRTVDGTPLTELGLGLGPNTNGRDCETCDHHGWHKHEERKSSDCKVCNAVGFAFFCFACQGSGKFKLRSGRTVECRDCRGNGVRAPNPDIYIRPYFGWGFAGFPRNARTCKNCLGTGKSFTQEVHRTWYSRCGHCNGTGEIKIYNPVILKGAMSQAQRKRMR
jgi:DnaJ-class molecular chaperone